MLSLTACCMISREFSSFTVAARLCGCGLMCREVIIGILTTEPSFPSKTGRYRASVASTRHSLLRDFARVLVIHGRCTTVWLRTGVSGGHHRYMTTNPFFPSKTAGIAPQWRVLVTRMTSGCERQLGSPAGAPAHHLTWPERRSSRLLRKCTQ